MILFTKQKNSMPCGCCSKKEVKPAAKPTTVGKLAKKPVKKAAPKKK
jgi:hypothetical protein